ncbi:MAG: cytochrome C biogenesis protein CcmE [Sulfobacillus acidophilus]|uniref:Cytochrome C biogenesis protein CcmE n=1 Tax=Sulfobacillus acidophilus TaxID=53633 RepID=A0A2T2WPB7_9FIRM|nr:MAG: cytochrome C biogenesis protein CcmE [Sulfobacillus acidophilus]
MPKITRLQLSVVVIVAVLVYMMIQGVHNFSSYFVTVRTYRAHLGQLRTQNVRVEGTVLARSVRYNPEDGSLRFTLTSGSEQLNVLYRGMMPDERFRDAHAIVKGKMGANGFFYAQKLEIQCPDHYAPSPRRDS